MEAAEEAIKAVKNTKTVPQHSFSKPVEAAIATIESSALPESFRKTRSAWYAIKVFERDEKALEQLNLSKAAQDAAGGRYKGC